MFGCKCAYRKKLYHFEMVFELKLPFDFPLLPGSSSSESSSLVIEHSTIAKNNNKRITIYC